MADEELLSRLKAALETHDIGSWNSYRSQNPLEYVDLLGAELRGADLRGADLTKADLRGADFLGVDLRGAHLGEADLSEADLSMANLSGADLSGGNLERALFVRTKLDQARLTGCRIYGISAWDTSGLPSDQSGLIVTPIDAPKITVDNLKLAQFIYLLLYSQEIRNIIDTVTSKVVLILGRFTEERMAILEAMREKLREYDLVPVIFDFELSVSRDLTETVSTLAHMARFILADITDPKSIPQELTAIIPHLPSVPVQALILASQIEYAMYEHWARYPWVRRLFRYNDPAHLLSSLPELIAAARHR